MTESGAGRLLRIELASGAPTIVADGLAQPEGIAVMADGRLAVAEVGLRRLVAVDPADGGIVVLARDLPVGDPRANTRAPLHLLTGVAEGADGSLYVTGDRDNSVLKLVLD